MKISLSRRAKIILAVLVFIAIVIVWTVCKQNLKHREEVNLMINSFFKTTSWDDPKTKEKALKCYGEKGFEKAVLSAVIKYQGSENERFNNCGVVNLLSYLHFIGCESEKLDSYLHDYTLRKLEEYKTNNDMYYAVETVKLLSKGGIEYEDVRNCVQEMFQARQAMLFNNGENDVIISLISCAEHLGEDNYYLTIYECLPYDKTVDYIKQNGVKLITKQGRGGFYDGKSLENESYWVDPLAQAKVKAGEVGTYHYSLSNMAAGDFCVRIEAKQWYQTPESDPNNWKYATLYYKDESIIYDYDEIREFLKIIDNGNSYYIPNTGESIFFILEEGQLSIYYHDLFSIVYS